MMITVFVFGALSSVLFHILTKEKKTSIDQHELAIAKSHSLQVVGVCMIYIIQLFNVIYLFVTQRLNKLTSSNLAFIFIGDG